MDDTSETDPIESEAARYDLKYIGMEGNIACFGKNRSIVTDLLYQVIVRFTWLLFNRNSVILSLQLSKNVCHVFALFLCLALINSNV